MYIGASGLHNISVLNFGFERSLMLCLLLNAAVFGSAWFFAARRMTRSRSQALLDAALLGYAVQYASVGIAGLLGCLSFHGVCGFAMFFVVGLSAAGWTIKPVALPKLPLRDPLIVMGVGVFVTGFVLAFVHAQADLPVISNDALTYHFPAAVQWLQQGRITLFQTWFFNPANTYSPLAGSTFIAWLLLPFGNDLLARFVEVPALLCVGLAMHRLCRELGVGSVVAAMVAGAAVFSRPIFMPCMMGKDDLFVAFFFIATLVALSRDRYGERFGAVRLGIGLGLLLATKYTALMSVPMLLLGIGWWCSGEPSRLGPDARADRGGTPRLSMMSRIFVSLGVAVVLAGPWYLRNWITTGDPLFPLSIPHVFTGLFTTSRSNAFRTWDDAISVLVDVHYGLPVAMLVVAGTATSFCLLFVASPGKRILRACAVGPILGVAIFYSSSPFPEVRFLLPVFLLMFACIGYAIQRLCRDESIAIVPAGSVLILSLCTLFRGNSAAGFSVVGLILVTIALGAYLWANGRRWRWTVAAIGALVAFGTFCYINWAAYCRAYLAEEYSEQSQYNVLYPQDSQLWTWVNTHLPADARVAYGNLYFVYPLHGSSLRRRLVYIPTRIDVKTIADLPWDGEGLRGEWIVREMDEKTIDGPDRRTWLKNLKSSGCEYLIVGRGGYITVPPERAFAEADPLHFEKVFSSGAGDVYQISWDGSPK